MSQGEQSDQPITSSKVITDKGSNTADHGTGQMGQVQE